MVNVAPEEVAKFDALAGEWWNPRGDFKTLHDINPMRLALIAARLELNGRAVVDVGCGGGILSEALAAAGASVTGIDLSADALETARAHAAAGGLEIDYQHLDASSLAQQRGGVFDAVVCMELLEHVPHPAHLVADCANLAAPGAWLFFSTLNRTPTAYAQAVLGAEYLLRLLPRGTHDYRKFVRPSELAAWARSAGLADIESIGLGYSPWSGRASVTASHAVNYVMICRKPGAA